MQAVAIIEKKRDGKILTDAEISFFVRGMTAGEIPDYQTSALCMAIYLQGLTEAETAALTRAMVATGETLDLSGLQRPTVDKHSTGGVGDKTTLIVAPLVVAAGAAMAKMSGRALGHTGGTIDKLESIPGFRTNLSPREILAQVDRIGLAVTGQTERMAPADRRLYALRDVTGTVSSLPLIAASIMAKKLAAGAATIALDIKYGSGALLPDPADGRRLAYLMSKIGEDAGRRVITRLSSMEQPLGRAVGNALEVREALDILQGGGPLDLRRLALVLAGELIAGAGLASSPADGEKQAAVLLDKGAALAVFAQMVAAQGGTTAIIDDPSALPRAKAKTTVRAPVEGYLARIDAAGVGRVAMALGAGRTIKDQPVDAAAGLILLAKAGDRLKKGAPMAELHTNRLAQIEPAQKDFLSCLSWSQTPVQPLPLFPPEPESV